MRSNFFFYLIGERQELMNSLVLEIWQACQLLVYPLHASLQVQLILCNGSPCCIKSVTDLNQSALSGIYC